MSDNKTSKKITLEIDGKKYEANPGDTIIQIADANGIYIPRFCYHKKLSVAANCRMCLVDVENARRSAPACATPIMDGMVVRTRSEKALQMQKDVMEFLLINHPLDCPICDQGGECELQDIALGYGNTESNYKEAKRAVVDPNLGSLVSTDMTRCILCTRCVRFGEEIAGVKELGVMGRGDHSSISTYISGDMLDSELSGNVIDLCPVGALTSKPFRFKARAWELKQFPAVSNGDALISDLNAHVYRDKLVRVVPRETEESNTWITDKDRFESFGLYNNRVQAPKIKKSGEWVDVSWEEALDFIKVATKQTIEKDGVDSVSALVSESSTSEELFLFKKLLKSLGSTNIDTKIKQSVNSNGVSSGFGLDCSLNDIETSDNIFILGSNLRKEYPLVNLSVKKAVENNNAKTTAWNVYDYNFNYDLEQINVDSNSIGYLFLSLLKALITRTEVNYKNGRLDYFLGSINPSNEVRRLADSLAEAKNPTIIIGQDVVSNKDFDFIYSVLAIIKEIFQIKGGVLPTSANSVGAIKVGATSGFADLYVEKFSANKLLNGQSNTKLLFLSNIDLEKDSNLGIDQVKQSINDIDIVVSFATHENDLLNEVSDIVLPIATHYETSGSFVNAFGKIKEFSQIVKPFEQSKELWRILRVVGNLLELEGFSYNSSKEVTKEAYSQELSIQIVDYSSLLLNTKLNNSGDLSFITTNSMYETTPLVRNSEPLQNTVDAKALSGVRISKELAIKLGITQDKTKLSFYNIENNIEYDCIVDKNLHSKNIMIPKDVFKSFLHTNSDISIKVIE